MNAYAKSLVFCFVFLSLVFVVKYIAYSQNRAEIPSRPPCAWEICSVDTMKTSRDKARAELNNPAFDEDIKNEVKLISETGANYIAIDTPYDEEFLPFLKRWISAARAENLQVWFRGNWSNWEGWFNYPKNLKPQDHIAKTYDFIKKHPELFEEGDIFDACPECENAGYWPQPQANGEYNKFIQDQSASLSKAFKAINKNVYTNLPSIIGGRAKEVLDGKTITSLGSVVAIDHYFNDPQNIGLYADFFAKNFKAKTLVSEFGAPVPGINGTMTEAQQADFIQKVFEIMYRKQIMGVNYWVLSIGTTPLINDNGSKRPAYDVVKKYFSPGYVMGTVKNTLGDNLVNAELRTSDGIKIRTDSSGRYALAIPPRSIKLETGGEKYRVIKEDISITSGRQIIEKDFVLSPLKPSFLYRLQLYLKGTR